MAAIAAKVSVTRIVVWAIASGLVVAMAGILPFSALAGLNGRVHPEIPWAALVTVAYLLLLGAWLHGMGWPASTASSRRRNLRLWRPERDAWSGENLATLIGIVTIIVGLYVWWIAASLDRRIADFSPYPTTAYRISLLVMGAVVSGVVEEMAFRGVMQSQLEKIGPSFAILVTSLAFSLAHAPQAPQAWLAIAPGYFIAGLFFGLLAQKSGSILPGMALHIAGDASRAYFVLLGGDASLLIAR